MRDSSLERNLKPLATRRMGSIYSYPLKIPDQIEQRSRDFLKGLVFPGPIIVYPCNVGLVISLNPPRKLMDGTSAYPIWRASRIK
jgi:hypothetical protein